MYDLIDRLQQGPWTQSVATPDHRHAVASRSSVRIEETVAEASITEPVTAEADWVPVSRWNGKTIHLPNGVLLRGRRL